MASPSKWYRLRDRQRLERIEQVEVLARSRITQNADSLACNKTRSKDQWVKQK